MLDTLAPFVGLFGLIGLAGLAGIRNPVEKTRPGAGIRLLGVLGLRARDLIGFNFVQLLVHTPLVLFLLWFLGQTLTYIPPVMP